MKTGKKFLVLQLREVCYNSYTYFSSMIAKELRARGHEVTIFSSADKPLDAIGQFAGASFDAVIDCNSSAPRLTMEEGGYFLDRIDAPFFNLLLDHPLYHHDSLKCTLQNYHVRCLDENHAAYLRSYYPHLKSVGLWTATGSAASDIPGTDRGSYAADISDADNSSPLLPIAARELPVLFSGTYTDPDEVMRAIRELPLFIQHDLELIISELITHPTQTIEGAVLSLGDSLDSYLPEAMPLFVQSCFLADTYVRAYRRRELVLAAARAGLPLRLVGSDWEKLPLPADTSVSLHPGVPYTESFSLMAHSRLTLNLMPEFKAGFHDRIFAAMLNGSVAVTDPSVRLLQEFSDKKELLFYNVTRLDEGCERLRRALEKPRMLQQIADQGLKAANKRFTWQALLPDFTV